MAPTSTKKRSRSVQKNLPNSSLLSLFLKEPPPGLFPSKEEFLRLLAVVFIAVSVFLACNFAVSFLNRQPKPFCESDQTSEDALPSPSNSLSTIWDRFPVLPSLENEEKMNSAFAPTESRILRNALIKGLGSKRNHGGYLIDYCEPCPDNGECFSGKLECVRGYKKHGRLCVEDGEISQTAKKLSEWVELHVCEAYVQFLCDGTGRIWVQEVDIWKELDEDKLHRTFDLNNETFQFTKQKVLETIRSLLETRENFLGIKELKCPDWLAERYKPLLCYIRQWISKHALILVPVSTALIGFITLFASLIRRIRRSRYLTNRAEQLYQQVCDLLEESAIMAKSVTGQGEPWVVASRLRDHLLLPRERKDPLLWIKVEELVKEDSRVDQYPKLVKGESKVVWEWQVEGSLSSSKMRKKGSASKVERSADVYESPGQQHRQSTLKPGRALFC